MCIEHGESEWNLWLQALTYFRENGDSIRIKECLNYIGKGWLLSPLLVLEILQGDEGELTFDCVKEYLLTALGQHEDTISESKEEIVENMKLIEKIKDERIKLTSERKMFE